MAGWGTTGRTATPQPPLQAANLGKRARAQRTFHRTQTDGKTQIFTRTCDSTRKIALTLRNLGFGAVPIHGQMSQPKRLGALNKFKVCDVFRSVCVRVCFVCASTCLGVFA